MKKLFSTLLAVAMLSTSALASSTYEIEDGELCFSQVTKEAVISVPFQEFDFDTGVFASVENRDVTVVFVPDGATGLSTYGDQSGPASGFFYAYDETAQAWRIQEAIYFTMNGSMRQETLARGNGYYLIEADDDVYFTTDCLMETMCGAETEPAAPEKAAFADVAVGAPYEDAVLWAVEQGITTGFDDGTFRPTATCTRGQVVTFLYRAAGEPAVTATENPFSDVVATSPYYNAILWAVEQGITTGYDDGTFRPGETCTSAQIVTFLHRAEGTKAATVSSALSADAAAPYVPAIDWAAQIGLLQADGFAWNNPSPRSDIVTYLYLIDATVEAA